MLLADSSHVRSVAVFRLSGAGFLGSQLLRCITLHVRKREFGLVGPGVAPLRSYPRTSHKCQQDRQQMGPKLEKDIHSKNSLLSLLTWFSFAQSGRRLVRHHALFILGQSRPDI